MWPKDDYQEHMLGYLDGVRVEFEQRVVQQPIFNQFYIELDIASEYLWQLIGASDRDWEESRYMLEISCDELLRVFYQVSHADTRLNAAIAQPRERAEMLR